MPPPDPLKLVLLIHEASSENDTYVAALETMGFHAMTTSSPSSAVKVAQELQPVAVLVDVQSKKLGWQDVISRLRSETDVAVLCLLGWSDADEGGTVEGCDLKLERTGDALQDLAPLVDLLRA